MTVKELNTAAKCVSRNVERDADMLTASHKGFLRFAEGLGNSESAPGSPVRIEGGDKDGAICTLGDVRQGEFRRMLANLQHERTGTNSTTTVRGIICLDLFWENFRLRHSQSLANRRDAPRMIALSSRISFRIPPCPGRRVGLGDDPI